MRGWKRPTGAVTAGPGDVDLLLLGQDGEAAFSDPPTRSVQLLLQESLGAVGLYSGGASFLCRKGAETPKHGGEPTSAAQVSDSPLLQPLLRRQALELLQAISLHPAEVLD